MHAVAQDLRYATRVLRKRPWVTTVVLLTLAFGIGVNTAIFSFVDAILLKPLPYPNADRIVGIWERRPSGQPNSMTTLNYLDYAQQSTVFERIAGTTVCCSATMLGGNTTPTPLARLKVSPAYFDVLGAKAAYGRTFISDEYPSTNKGWSVVLEPYASIVLGKDLQRSLYLLLAAVGMVLLFACVNVANVMLAWALEREREVAVRLALGAAHGRLIRQFLTESLLINETMARKYFGNEEPVGQHLLMGQPGFGAVYSGEASSFEIVGVIAEKRLTPFDDTREHAAVYVSNEQDSRAFCCIIVRTSLDPSRIERGLAATVAAVDKDQPVTHVKSLDQLKSESMIPDRLRAGLLGLFAATALALSALGIYGMIAYSVVQRTHEIGIRAALGASPANLVALVVGGGMTLAVIGLVVGSVATLGVTRLLRSFLFGVESSDPITWIATVVVLAGVAAVACYIPARHAARVDSLDALRAE